MAYDENMDIPMNQQEPRGLLGWLIGMLRLRREKDNHFKSNKGGPVDSGLESNFNDESYPEFGGDNELPKVRDYSGTSGGGMY